MKSRTMKNKLTARELALKVLIDIDQNQAYANLTLNEHLDKVSLGKEDKGFCTELVYGTVRNLLTIDYILQQRLSRPLIKLTIAMKNILRLGAYQIVYLDKIPDAAACNESVNLAKKYGHQGVARLVNGVLRGLSREKVNIKFPDKDKELAEYVSIKYSHPKWLVERWLKNYGQEFAISLCEANNQSADVTIRLNTLKAEPESILQGLEAQGVKYEQGKYSKWAYKINNFGSIGKLEQFKQGQIQVQDESSMLVAEVVNPKPGEKVLDLCCAPGGKTTHMAQLMQNQGEIVAIDIHNHKLKLVNDNCRRLGVTIVRTQALDATKLDESFYGQFDKVLVDAPCTGLGVLKRRADSRWRKAEDDIRTLSQLQALILAEAARCVKPGGMLVYSTCTITHEENQLQARAFTQKHPEFSLCSVKEVIADQLWQEDEIGIQLWPHIHGTDGFYICAWERKKSND